MPHIRIEVDTYADMARRALDATYRQACEWLDALGRKPQEER